MLTRFVAAWLVISGVVAYDVFLTVKHLEVMGDLNVEQNPIGSYIIRSDGGVPLFVAMKAMGMSLALLFSFVLWQRDKLRGKLLGCTYVMAGAKLVLLGYLSTDLVGAQVREMLREDLAREMSRPHAAPLLPASDGSEIADSCPVSAPWLNSPSKRRT